MSPPDRARVAYEPPRIEEHGTLRDITAQVEHVIPGFHTSAVASVPQEARRRVATPQVARRRVRCRATMCRLRAATRCRAAVAAVPGTEQGGGGGANVAGGGANVGGAGASGGGDAALPFTGFPAVVAGAVGAGMASAGAALRRRLRRR